MTSTASRLATVQRAIENLEAQLSQSQTSREKSLMARIAALEKELADVRRGEFEVLQGPQAEEGVREVLGSAIYSYSMNYLGLPAGNIPAGFHDGLPIGVQLIGQRWREDWILDACEVIEAQAGVMAERLWS